MRPFMPFAVFEEAAAVGGGAHRNKVRFGLVATILPEVDPFFMLTANPSAKITSYRYG